jgi:PQQ-dependent dehydrogenase (methanol/ethanol family)
LDRDSSPFTARIEARIWGSRPGPPGAYKIGGGSVWGWISYDPELNLIYYGTSNPGPWDDSARPGANQFTSGIFARDADTGDAVWYYQFSPHDLYDYDGVNENVLVDLPIGGKTRKVLLHPDRNGYVYVFDRATGEVLSAKPFAPITTSSGVDLKTGELKYVADKKPILGTVVRGLCPAPPGAKDWQPSSFSPRTGLLYIPHNHLCMDKEDVSVNYIAGTPYVGSNVVMYDAPGGFGGQFTAWDPVAGKVVWTNPDKFPVWSGALATAGDIVFYGTLEGWFKAVDAKTGTVLWQFKTGSGIIGQPMTYKGADGKQYVAVLSGIGGWAGAIVAGDLDPRDPTAALGFVGATTDLPKYSTMGGMLYVFELP